MAAADGFSVGQKEELGTISNVAPKYGMLIPSRVFVGGIANNTTESDLRQFFSTYGPIRDCKIIQDRAGVSKGYGFVTFETVEDAEKLMKKEGDHVLFKDRKLNIGPAIRKQPTQSRMYDPTASNAAVLYAGGLPYLTHPSGLALIPAHPNNNDLSALAAAQSAQLAGGMMLAAGSPQAQLLIPAPGPAAAAGSAVGPAAYYHPAAGPAVGPAAAYYHPAAAQLALTAPAPAAASLAQLGAGGGGGQVQVLTSGSGWPWGPHSNQPIPSPQMGGVMSGQVGGGRVVYQLGGGELLYGSSPAPAAAAAAAGGGGGVQYQLLHSAQAPYITAAEYDLQQQQQQQQQQQHMIEQGAASLEHGGYVFDSGVGGCVGSIPGSSTAQLAPPHALQYVQMSYTLAAGLGAGGGVPPEPPHPRGYGVKRVLAPQQSHISMAGGGLYGVPPIKIIAGQGGQRIVSRSASSVANNEIQIVPKSEV